MQQLIWRLRLACAERNIWSAAELRRLVARRTGVALSPQTVQVCFRDRPTRIDVRTLTAILNALACPLEEVLRFTPPARTGEARASAEEAVRYRRSPVAAAPRAARGHAETAPLPRGPRSSQAKAKPRVARPPTDRARLLAALSEGAEPVAAEHLQRRATQATTLARAKKQSAGRR